MTEQIHQGNIDALNEGYQLLLDHPCIECSNESCDICRQARDWLKENICFINSPLLEMVVNEFIENHPIHKLTNKEVKEQ